MEDKIKKNFVGIYEARSNAEEDAINAVYATKKRPRFEYTYQKLDDMNGILRAIDKYANEYTHMCQVKDKLNYVITEDAKNWKKIESKGLNRFAQYNTDSGNKI